VIVQESAHIIDKQEVIVAEHENWGITVKIIFKAANPEMHVPDRGERRGRAQS
jgi:hypothetical protein